MIAQRQTILHPQHLSLTRGLAREREREGRTCGVARIISENLDQPRAPLDRRVETALALGRFGEIDAFEGMIEGHSDSVVASLF